MIEVFGKTPEGDDVMRCQIRNGGAVASIITWGATLQDFRLDRLDRSLVLGGNDMAAYLGPMRYFGAIVGPVANRIAGGQMEVKGQHFDLDKNEAGRTTLHGGLAGFSDRNWSFDMTGPAECRLMLSHPDGLGGFPGNISVGVTYRLDKSGALDIEIIGMTDAPTYFSPAFHGYWNLSGKQDLSDHRLTVFAPTYLPVDDDQIPLGRPSPVDEGPFDYRMARPVGAVLDHNFCLPFVRGQMQEACKVEAAGLSLEVSTNQRGVQIYNGLHIQTGASRGHGGRAYGPCAGLAIEPQFWPDTPHQPGYPSSLISPGQVSKHRSRFEFATND